MTRPAPRGCGGVRTCARPIRFWPGSSTAIRPSIRGHGSTSSRRWTSTEPALFQVTGQQLSVAATRRTIARIEARFDGHLPSPAELLAVDPTQLRAAGLSGRKVDTLRDLAQRLVDGRLDADALAAMPDDDFIAALTAISGIGPWTAQGVLLVALRREDVVLPGDLACERRSGTRTNSTSCRTKKKSSRLPRSGDRSAAWQRAISSRVRSTETRRKRDKGNSLG